MFNSNSIKNITQKDLVKKINYNLTSNFFSLSEIKELKLRKVKKIVRLISKLEKVKLKRKEVSIISSYLLSNLQNPPKVVSKIWHFTSLLEKYIKQTKKVFEIIFSIFRAPNYRKNKFELMLN